jgi:alkylresorcinol/alkylpyrone synthase
MPRIQSVATALPEYKVDQDFVQDFAREVFRDRIASLDRLLPLFANAGIEHRYFVAPPAWYREPHDLAERSALYVTAATELSARAAREALARANLRPEDVDTILYVNTTGLATPSIDARLVNVLGLRRDVRRLPLWGLGCAGGVAGLSHAHHLALGSPTARILLVATELCGLTFMPDDPSKSNLVATALFADGSAAAVITGDQVPGPGLEFLDTQSRFYPDSLDVMGWTVLQQGLQVVFARRIPDIVQENAAEDLGGMLAPHGLGFADVGAFLFHPGGAKVIEAYEEALGLGPTAMDWTRGVLRDYGNMSSTTVLFVVERYLAERGHGRGGHGLITALGPGFCSESVLVEL